MGCALLAVTACGAPTSMDAPTSAVGGVRMERTVPGTLEFGRDHRFDSGVTVVVSTPKMFRPSDTAYPQSERAVAFEVSIYNDGPQPYRLSDLVVRAAVNDVPAKQVVDATQGFNGIVDADRDVPPQRNVRVNLAFAVPPEPAPLSVTVRPEPGSEDTAVYVGSA
ncbi:hypothetical protein [Amycolatopsis arida]|nr:hypothetical protein [Amycolatopsis arida]